MKRIILYHSSIYQMFRRSVLRSVIVLHSNSTYHILPYHTKLLASCSVCGWEGANERATLSPRATINKPVTQKLFSIHSRWIWNFYTNDFIVRLDRVGGYALALSTFISSNACRMESISSLDLFVTLFYHITPSAPPQSLVSLSSSSTHSSDPSQRSAISRHASVR